MKESIVGNIVNQSQHSSVLQIKKNQTSKVAYFFCLSLIKVKRNFKTFINLVEYWSAIALLVQSALKKGKLPMILFLFLLLCDPAFSFICKPLYFPSPDGSKCFRKSEEGLFVRILRLRLISCQVCVSLVWFINKPIAKALTDFTQYNCTGLKAVKFRNKTSALLFDTLKIS